MLYRVQHGSYTQYSIFVLCFIFCADCSTCPMNDDNYFTTIIFKVNRNCCTYPLLEELENASRYMSRPIVISTLIIMGTPCTYPS